MRQTIPEINYFFCLISVNELFRTLDKNFFCYFFRCPVVEYEGGFILCSLLCISILNLFPRLYLLTFIVFSLFIIFIISFVSVVVFCSKKVKLIQMNE